MKRRKMTYMNRHVATCLTSDENAALREHARKSGIKVAVFIRSIIVDALCEEGYDFSERSRSKISSQIGEGLPTGGYSTP